MQESLSTFLVIGFGPASGRSDGSSLNSSRLCFEPLAGMAQGSECTRVLTSAPGRGPSVHAGDP
jgi:hypothetical protein